MTYRKHQSGDKYQLINCCMSTDSETFEYMHRLYAGRLQFELQFVTRGSQGRAGISFGLNGSYSLQIFLSS